MIEIIPTGNNEVDRKLGGGLPLPIMMLIEGTNGTGKSVLCAQFMTGLLKQGMRVMLMTNNNVINYLEKMKLITYDFYKYFLNGQLQMVPMQAYNITWSKEQANQLLPLIERYLAAQTQTFDVVIIDPLTLLCIYADTGSILNFFTKMKHHVSNGTSLIMTMHDNILTDDVALQIKSTCDANIVLSKMKLGGKTYNTFENVKFAGAKKAVASTFSFDVTNQFGIKIVPITSTQG